MSAAPDFGPLDQPAELWSVPTPPDSSDELRLQPVPPYIARHLSDLAVPAVAALQRDLFAIQPDEASRLAHRANVRRLATERLYREFDMLSSDTASELFKRVYAATEEEAQTKRKEDFYDLKTQYANHPVIGTFELLRARSMHKGTKLTAILLQRTSYLLISRYTPEA